MERFKFIGTEKRISQNTGNSYYMLFWGKEIDIKKGKGIKPLQSRITSDMFTEFSALELGDEFSCNYQCILDNKGIYQYVIQRYEI